MPSWTRTISCRFRGQKLLSVLVRRSRPSSRMGTKSSSITISYIMRVSISVYPERNGLFGLNRFTYLIDFEYGRLLACMGDKDGARTQLDLVLSGKHLEVNAAGRKVRRRSVILFYFL